MNSSIRAKSLLIAALLTLSACGGGSAPPPVPTATLSASAGDVRQGGSVTLTWSSTNATGCTAAGDWSGSLGATGTQSVTVSKTSAYSISCTGSGGTATGSAAVTAWTAPKATVSSSDAAILASNPVTITWSSSSATACTIGGLAAASGTSGSLATDKLAVTTTYQLSCTNPVYSGVDAGTASVVVNVSTTYSLLVTAKFEQPGAATAVNASGYLLENFDSPVVSSIPYVWIELQRADGSVVTGSYASANGQVLFTNLDPATKYTPALRSKSLHDGFDLWVVNNRAPISTAATHLRDRYAPYVDKGVEYAADVKKVAQAADVTATLGWNSTTKTLDNAKRVSAPYSIIAMVNVVESWGKSLAGGAAATASPGYTVLWTTANKGGSASFTDNLDSGLVQGSGGFSSAGYKSLDSSGLSTGPVIAENWMFLSGDPAWEIMEFGGVVTVHEAWHFIQQTRYRSTILGGSHTRTGYFDPRLVWNEGMADAVPLLVARSARLDRPVLMGGEYLSGTRDYSAANPATPVGWFQEMTIPRLVWSLYDPNGSFKMTTDAILGPLFSTGWAAGIWPTTVWAYGKYLKSANPSLVSAMDALAAGLNITFAGSDELGTGESNLGNRSAADSLPIFTAISPGTATNLCSAGAPNEYNKLGNTRGLKLIGDGRSHVYTITGPAQTVPQLDLSGTDHDGYGWYRKGLSSFSLTATISNSTGLAYGAIRECTVTISEDPAQNSSCSAVSYTPPAEQCWTITVSP